MPFPSNQNAIAGLAEQRPLDAPWKRAAPTEPPPMMFQVRFRDGRVVSYAYADLRETRLRDAGHLQLCLLGMEKYCLTIEGRNLSELDALIGAGKIRSLEELGPRTFDRPEAAPSIDKITVETLTGPSF
ncbi:hypothetical protein [Pseudobythopirellula maris]|nr:hypothetical protein [Pseudobythopirellula maris]